MPALVRTIVRAAHAVTLAAGLVLLLTAQILIPGSGSGVPSSRAIATTSPLSGGGDLSADRTLSCPTCVTSSRSVSTSGPLSGGGDLSADRTLSCPTCVTQAYATVQDEGGALTQRSVLNFTGAGVSCADNAGAARTDCTIGSGGADPWTTLTSSADVTTTGAALQLHDVTGISFTASASTVYLMECRLIVSTSATTNGLGLAWNTPATPTDVFGAFCHSASATASHCGLSNADDTITLNTGSWTTAGGKQLITFNTLFRNGANSGATQLRVASELAAATATVTVYQNSICQYRSLP